MIAGPGELIVVDRVGAKANSGTNTGEYCYFICPHEGGWLARSFESNKILVTRDVRKLSAPEAEVSSLVSLRHAIHTGMFRDGSGLAGAPATAVASGCLALLADEVRNGGDANPDRYLVLLDPTTGRPARLVSARSEGFEILVEPELTTLHTKVPHNISAPRGKSSPPVPHGAPPLASPGAVGGACPADVALDSFSEW
jgi:hypothetical protein